MNYSSTELNELFIKIQAVSKMSKTNAKLGSYIQKNYMQIIFMTASQLAEAVGISQGSVSRFCISLDFKGYNDFLKKMQEYVSKEITLPQRLAFVAGSASNNSAVFTSEHDNIDNIESLTNTPNYARLKNKIAQAEKIILLSARMSATLLPYAAYLFSNIRDDIIQVTPGNPLWDTLPMNKPEGSLILAFVFPRYSNQLLAKLRQLREVGFDIEVLTDVSFPFPLASEFSHLKVPTTVSSIFDIYSSPMLLINLLARDIVSVTPGVEARMKRLEEIDNLEKIYYKTE